MYKPCMHCDIKNHHDNKHPDTCKSRNTPKSHHDFKHIKTIPKHTICKSCIKSERSKNS